MTTTKLPPTGAPPNPAAPDGGGRPGGSGRSRISVAATRDRSVGVEQAAKAQAAAALNRRRPRERRRPNPLAAWGPLIGLVAVILIALGAMVSGPLTGVSFGLRPFGTPTPIVIADDAGVVIPAMPSGAAVIPTAAVPGGGAAASSVRPTPAPFMAAVAPQPSNTGYPGMFEIPPGRNRFPTLGAPGQGGLRPGDPEAIQIMNEARAAILQLRSLRERQYATYTEVANGQLAGVEDYVYLYQAPDTRYRTGTFTVPFGDGTDTVRPEQLLRGKDFFKPEGGDTWSKSESRNPFNWPTAISVFGSAIGAVSAGPDVIDGREYRVIEYDQMGNDEVGSPGFSYRNRVWIDNETKLPFKMEKVSFIQRMPRGGQDTRAVQQLFYAVSLFDGFNQTLPIPNPVNIINPTPVPIPTQPR